MNRNLLSFLRNRRRFVQIPAFQKSPERRASFSSRFFRFLKKQRYAFYPNATPLFGTLPMNLAPERPSLMVVLSIIAGLPAALWTYKCLMMVIFQRRIIYMGYAPLGSRKELVKDVPSSHLRGLSCEEITINSEGNIKLAGIVVSQEGAPNVSPNNVVMYLQGNVGNPLHRLPVFQRLLHAPVYHSSLSSTYNTTVVAVAPRSYWKSSPRRPSQRGILTDYYHVLHYILKRFPDSRIVLYGHSLGGAAAVCLLSQLDENIYHSHHNSQYSQVRGLILENPFASIPGMVRALYPQRWLPYHYLAPLALDQWDAMGALRAQSDPTNSHGVLRRLARNMLIIASEYDEIVPPTMATELWQAAMDSTADKQPRMAVIKGALHENAWDKRDWLPEIKRYFSDIKGQ